MRTSGSRLFILIFLLSLSSYLIHRSLLDQKFQLVKRYPRVPRRNITILLWHWPFGRSYSLHGDTCLDKYNISQCFLSDKPSTFSFADVVVFHHHELKNGRSSLPLHLARPASQHWVWLSMEPPVNNGNLTPYKDLFNWTMSYRRDADIFIPYGKTVPEIDNLNYEVPQNRSCLVSWVVTKYHSDQARAAIYQSLKNYLPIEVYGGWTKRYLSKKELLPTIGRCLFYLAFENSEATDYISEKLWRNAFQAGAVPVVFGPNRATYEALAPPGSFIHVKDFHSHADLAAYLKSLASDRQAYEAYFQWHRTHRIKTYTDWRERLCQICVNYARLPTNKVYFDLESWVKR
ncbi:alpha-(1,3)-fucosyltransferase 7 [Myripristis murdjan]|uniref:alpha-(1,3)-fucosyltransferase 7 n=1 Tax=Myripristis murdjan TaxID=586833 RepID=UPI001175FF4D|nr:alpha-(1,3)-fucosyltransferase 7 [Myripristis murdjan]XP_029916246.1 alpha-(1,3)-fucosyltransferase 7 [Myripristis murdjan]